MTNRQRAFLFRLTPVVLTQLTGLACGVVGVKLSSRFVPPEILGPYGIFMSFTTLGMWMIHAGLIKYVSRHWAAAPAKSLLLRNMVRLWAAKLPWIVLGSAGATLAVSLLTRQNAWMLFFPMLAISGILSLVAMGQTALQVNRQHWTDFGISAIGSLTRTFLPLSLFLLLGTAAGLYGGLTLHILIGLGLVAWVMRVHWRQPAAPGSPPIKIDSLYTGSYFIVLALAGWALSGANRWIVAGNFGNTEAGYFILASNIALIVPTFIGSIITQLAQPGLFALGDRPATDSNLSLLLRRVDVIAAIFCVLAIPGVIVLHHLMPCLVGPLVHPNYQAALPWVLPVGFFGSAVITAQYYHTLLLAARKEKACAPVDLTAAAVLIGGSALTALWGQDVFKLWLMSTPLIPWLIVRTVARRLVRK